MTEQEMLDELKNFDTPSITNVVATYPGDPLCLGLYNPWSENWYTDQSLRCMYPELGPTVGYAVTCTFGLPDPNYSGVSFMDVLDALDASPKPTIFVFQQKFPPEIAGKVGLAGGNMTTAMQAIGCVGAISNGPSRDIDEIRPMKFQYLLSGVTAGHGAQAIHAVNVPVSVAGMDVAPGRDHPHGRKRRGEIPRGQAQRRAGKRPRPAKTRGRAHGPDAPSYVRGRTAGHFRRALVWR